MATRTAERIPEHLIEQAKRADLVALAEQHTTLRRESAKGRSGPCPKCGGDDRFYVNVGNDGEGFWACRQCHQKPGDAIAFLRWVQPGLSFAAAVEQLTGQGVALATGAPPAQRRQPERKRAEPQPEEWRQRAGRLVADAQRRLWAPEGEPARAYLAGRALEPATWLAFGLGFRHDAPLPGTKGKRTAPAVACGWVAVGGAGVLVAMACGWVAVGSAGVLVAEACGWVAVGATCVLVAVAAMIAAAGLGSAGAGVADVSWETSRTAARPGAGLAGVRGLTMLAMAPQTLMARKASRPMPA